MDGLYRLSGFMVQFFGPMSLVCLVLIYMSARRIRKTSSLKEAMLIYIKRNMEQRGHAGILTYLFILGSIFFVLSAAGLLVGRLVN